MDEGRQGLLSVVTATDEYEGAVDLQDRAIGLRNAKAEAHFGRGHVSRRGPGAALEPQAAPSFRPRARSSPSSTSRLPSGSA